MKKVFLNTILIASLFIVTTAKAQTVVSAKGKTFVLNQQQKDYLKRFNNPVVTKAIDSCINIKYNSTADVIIDLLSLPKAPKVKQLLYTTK